MTGPWDPVQPGWGQPGRPGPDPTRIFPQPGPWTGAVPPPYGPPPYGPPPYGPPPGQPYGPPPGQPYGGPTGVWSGRGDGFPPEIGGGGRGRGPLLGGLAAMLVLISVLGIVLYIRSGTSAPAPAAAGTSSATSPAPSASGAPAPPPLPSSVAPSRTTPAPSTTTSGSGTASAQDVRAISGLAQQLVNAISAGDQPTLQAIACGTFGATLAQFTTPTDPPLTYDHTEAVSVTGDDGKAAVFAAFGSSAPTPQTMTVKRASGRWKVCALGDA